MMYGNDDNGGDEGTQGPGECGSPGGGQNDGESANGGAADEFDVDMTPETALEGEAEVECLGAFETLEAFLRSQVELLLIADGMWLLDCIDYERVHELLEGDEYRIWRDDFGRVFRRRLPSPPDSA
jgi:hypothetical protein